MPSGIVGYGGNCKKGGKHEEWKVLEPGDTPAKLWIRLANNAFDFITDLSNLLYALIIQLWVL